MNIVLWILQVLLALLFLFAGGVKLLKPVEPMIAQMKIPLSAAFLHFIAVVEVLGALGLILPSLLKIKPILTPLAAVGLAIVMAGAVVFSIMSGDVAASIFPLVIGLLCVLVAYGHWRLKQIG
jgi:uncharacterized membrane protein YphA (DoxX/SURF4 family)